MCRALGESLGFQRVGRFTGALRNAVVRRAVENRVWRFYQAGALLFWMRSCGQIAMCSCCPASCCSSGRGRASSRGGMEKLVTGLPRTRTSSLPREERPKPVSAFAKQTKPPKSPPFAAAPQPVAAAHATTGLAQSAAPTFGSRSAPPRGHRSTKWAAGLVRPTLTAAHPTETPPGSPGPRLPAVPA